MQHIAAALAVRSLEIANEAGRQLVDRLPGYQEAAATGAHEPGQVVHATVRLVLTGLSEDRLPTLAEAEVTSRAARDAEHGVSVGVFLAELSEVRGVIARHLDGVAAGLECPPSDHLAAERLLAAAGDRLTGLFCRAYVGAVEEGSNRQSEALRRLMEVARAVNRSLEPLYVARQGLDAIVGALGGSGGGLWLEAPEGGLGLAFTQGLSHEQDREMRLLDDIRAILAGLPFPGFASALRAPMRGPGEAPTGAVVVLFGSHREFTQDDRSLIEAATDHLGLALARAEQHRMEARTDHLTGLTNRAEFERAVARAVAAASRHGGALAVAVVDLDGLKAINDEQGHDTGDSAIRAVADALRRSVRASDTCSRIGGDEFALAMPDADLGQAQEVVRRIRLLLPHTAREFGLGLAVSAGVAAWEPGMDPARLFKLADSRLYDEKRLHHGRGAESD